MGKNGQIEHEGIITEISAGKIKVGFAAQPSCSACHAKGVCSVEEKTGEEIVIEEDTPGNYSLGEKVNIIIRETLGLKAVWLAYVLPFIILMMTLFISVTLLKNELFGAIISLVSLFPYYLLLYLFRKKIQKEVNFTIEKI